MSTFDTHPEAPQDSFHLTLAGGNGKLGTGMPVSTSSPSTCPPTCPLREIAGEKHGCYADYGHLSIHWKKRPERFGASEAFFRKIRSIPLGRLWRLNQAGDLPHTKGEIDKQFVDRLIEAAKGTRPFGFTHHAPTPHNIAVIRHANASGVTLSWSANSLKQADELAALDAGPVVTLLPSDAPARQKTPGGRTVIVCPQQEHKAERPVTCDSCGLCQKVDRPVIVGFRAHGSGARLVDEIIKTHS